MRKLIEIGDFMTEYEEKMLAESKKRTTALYAIFVVLSFIAGALMAG